jgi:hypothetical protein
LQELIITNSKKDDIDSDQVFSEIQNCKIWNFDKTYNLSVLAKGFIHIDIINLLIKFKIINKDRVKFLDSVVNKLVLDFKILIWEYKNVKQIELEIKRSINNKMKKSINKSKIVRSKLDKITSSRWELWNSLAFE